MTNLLNTTETLTHVSPLPASSKRDAAVTMLHDHDHFIDCNPHHTKKEAIAAPEPAPEMPEGIEPLGGTKCFQVTDVVHALPAGLWDSDVVSTYEFTDTKDGVFVRIRSPMSVLLETVWTIREAKEGESELEMVEEVTLNCSRLLHGVVKGACESNWKSIHEKMIGGIKA